MYVIENKQKPLTLELCGLSLFVFGSWLFVHTL